MPPSLLILETSGKVGQVGLAEGTVMRGSWTLDETRRHARDLAPAVANLLRAADWRPRDLQGVIVSSGPGSYTGLRVGIMSAKALAYASGCALVAVETFQAIVQRLPFGVGVADVIADAQQNKLYVQRFTRAATEWQADSPLEIVTLEDWLERRGEAWATGPGLHAYGQRIPDVRLADKTLWEPSLESLLQLGLARFEAGLVADIWSLEPHYARPSSAEEKWQALGR